MWVELISIQDQPKWWRSGKREEGNDEWTERSGKRNNRKEMEIQSRTNLNGGDLEKEKREKIGGQRDLEGETIRTEMEIQSRTNLNGGELERIEGLCQEGPRKLTK